MEEGTTYILLDRTKAVAFRKHLAQLLYVSSQYMQRSRFLFPSLSHQRNGMPDIAIAINAMCTDVLS